MSLMPALEIGLWNVWIFMVCSLIPVIFLRDYTVNGGKYMRNWKVLHYSDCAVYNEPAYPAGECDCGAVKAHKRWWSYLYRLFCIQGAHQRSVLGSRLRNLFGLPPSASNREPYQNERCRPFDNSELPLRLISDSSHKREVLLYEDVHHK